MEGEGFEGVAKRRIGEGAVLRKQVQERQASAAPVDWSVLKCSGGFPAVKLSVIVADGLI